MNHRVRKSIIIMLTLVYLTSQAHTALADHRIHPRLQERLNNIDDNESVRVIIEMSDKLDANQYKHLKRTARRKNISRSLRDHAQKSGQSLTRQLSRSSAKRIKSLWLINAAAVTLSKKQIQQLTRYKDIHTIRLDYIITLPSEPEPSTAFTPTWNIERINAPALWALGVTGQNTVVANMDTGVDVLHPDLASQWRGGDNSWYDPYNQHTTPFDHYGHGTKTMGVMVAGDLSGQNLGVAPDAKWIAVKIFNDSQQAYISEIHAGFQWLLDPDGDPDTDDAPDVVNNSWGYEDPGVCVTEFQTDIEILQAADIAVVFSAGNEGPADNTDISPANNTPALAVGATDPDDDVSYFSSRGPSACDDSLFPHLAAPGSSIKSTTLSKGGQLLYAYPIQGTSFAAPHVAGAMALLRSALPNVPADMLRQALIQTAQDLGNPGPDNDFGNGMIDVLAAWQYLMDQTCKADLDHDGDVDLDDYTAFLADYLPHTCDTDSPCPADLNGDNTVNLEDIAILWAEFNRTNCPDWFD